jgi:hypothetical protein
MIQKRLHGVIALGAIFLGASVTPSAAHHSYVMFDHGKTATIQGTVAKIDWSDPHVYFWLYVANDKGAYDLYALESASVNNLARRGWTKSTIQTGEKVTIAYHPLKDGRNGGSFVQATHADGSISKAGQ